MVTDLFRDLVPPLSPMGNREPGETIVVGISIRINVKMARNATGTTGVHTVEDGDMAITIVENAWVETVVKPINQKKTNSAGCHYCAKCEIKVLQET